MADPVILSSEVGTWVVEFTLPPTEKRRWTQNKSMSVFTNSARRAMDLIDRLHPECTVIVVRKASKGMEVLVDPDVLEVKSA